MSEKNTDHCGKYVGPEPYEKTITGWACGNCKVCRKKIDGEKYRGLQKIEWDGMTPLVSFETERFFFYWPDLAAALDGLPPGGTVGDLRLMLCIPNEPDRFDMNEYLCDVLPEDEILEAGEIEKVVNDWIEATGPFSWIQSELAVTDESVMKHLSTE